MNVRRQKPKKAKLPSRIISDYDEALVLLRHIETLAGLLEVAGQNELSPVDAVLVSDTGTMIRLETAQLRGMLQTLVRVACEK
jgi:hypothetical protein